MKKQTKPKEAVIYTRFSTDTQTSNSTEYQLDHCREFCRQNGYKVVDEYIDEGYSGGSADRPEFQRLLRDAKAPHTWSAVVVYNLSRFSREESPQLYERELNDHGIVLLSTKEPNDDSANGRFIRRNIYNNNALYRESTAAHTTDGMRNKAAKGVHCGGVPPLGYVVNHESRLAVDEEEAKLVNWIFKMFDAGMSYSQMAQKLNDEGHRTKAGRKFTKNSFSNILKQEKYVGILRWNVRQSKDSRGKRNNAAEKPEKDQVCITDGCPAIVPKDLFERVQKKLEGQKLGKGASKARYPYLLSGRDILYCAECGSKMIGTRHYSRGKAYVTYYCPKHKNGPCSTKEISAENLDKFVVSKVVENVVTKADAQALTAAMAHTVSTNSIKAKIRAKENSIGNVIRSIEIEPSPSLSKHLKQLEFEKTLLEDELQKSLLPSVTVDEDNIRRVRKRLAGYIYKSQDPNAYMLLKAVVDRIEVDNEGVSITLSA